MATLKHINSKNADYGAAEQYLLFEHDEFTMKPVLDETGRLIPREDYRLSTLNCDGEDFAVACMPYVNVPNDLSKVKTKMALNLTKRQLICFSCAAAVGIPSYLLARGSIGNTGAMFLMLAVMLPAFLLAMYEKDGLPAEKVLKNIIRARFLRPGVRPYQTQNIYAPFAGRGAVRKEDAIAKGKSNQRKKNRKG